MAAINVTVAAGQRSDAIKLSIGQAVTITAGTGATVTPEYTASSARDVENGAAVWANWPQGPLSARQSKTDVNLGATAFRVSSSGGSASIAVTDAINNPTIISSTYWQSQQINEPRLPKINPVRGGTINYALLGDSRLALHCKTVVNCNSIAWNGGGSSASGQILFGFSSTPNMRSGMQIRFVANTGDASTAVTGVYTINAVVSTTSYSAACDPNIASGTASSFGPITCLDWYADCGWSFWANALSGQRLRCVYNGGRGGDRAEQVAARVTEVTSRTDVQYCFIDVGVNNYNNALTTYAATTAYVLSSIDAACQSLLSANITPVLLTMYPISSDFNNAANIVKYITQHNNLLRNYAANNPRVMIIDQAAAVTDPTTGYLLGGVLGNPWTHDGLHPSRMIGRSVGLLISDSFGGSKPMPSILTNSFFDNARSDASNSNAIQNSPWVATGGTLGTGGAGTVAQGWNVLRNAGAGTFVSSAPARTLASDGDAIGFNQRVVYTSGGADTFEARINIGNDSNYWTLITAGIYELRGTVKLANVSGSNMTAFSVQSYLVFTDPATAVSYNCLDQFWSQSTSDSRAIDSAVGGYLSTTDCTLTLRSQPWTFTSAPTAQFGIGIRFLVTFSAIGTAVTMDYGRWSFVKVG